MFDEYDHVELTETLDTSLPASTRGAVVMVYDETKPAEYEVEFVDDRGDTIAVRTVKENQLRKVTSPS